MNYFLRQYKSDIKITVTCELIFCWRAQSDKYHESQRISILVAAKVLSTLLDAALD